MDGSADEYFGTLGGSLMKDLLAGLQVDDNDWSIEELEKELLSYDRGQSMSSDPLPPLSAASLVVSHAQERSSSILPLLPPPAPLPPPGMGGGVGGGTGDAWIASLQNFSSLSLQNDFLAADSARKQTRPPPGMASLVGAEDYDIKEKQVIAPPPGLGGSVAQEAAPLPPPPVVPAQEFSLSPPPHTNNTNGSSLPPIPVDPKQGVAVVAGLGEAATPPPKATPAPAAPGVVPITAPSFPANNNNANNNNNAFLAAPPSMLPPQGAVVPPVRGLPLVAPPGHFLPGTIPGLPNAQLPPPPMGVPIQMPMTMNMNMPINNMPLAMATPAPLTGVVIGSAVATPGPAWQNPRPMPVPQQPPQQPPAKVFCNPYPGAPAVPATALVSSCMSGRDVAYVVHAILRPVLAEGTSENDYYIQYIKRRVGSPQADPINPKRAREASHDVTSRANKSKEWASEKSVLGHVTKSNVARPRALIATPQPSPDQENKEQRQRANLWKARVYCDQAYQAYQNVIDIWRASSSSGQGIPPQVQMHLKKLMKCMGIVQDSEKKVYTVSKEALKLIAKLEKGRTLICRVLEQALLPPNAAQALLPALYDVIIPLPSSGSGGDPDNNSSFSSGVEEKTTGRLFQAISSIVPKLSISGDTLVKCLEVALSHGTSATCSIFRMSCLHSLLQKGGQLVPQDPSEEVREAWGIAERKLMSGLQLA